VCVEVEVEVEPPPPPPDGDCRGDGLSDGLFVGFWLGVGLGDGFGSGLPCSPIGLAGSPKLCPAIANAVTDRAAATINARTAHNATRTGERIPPP
jgi:hypothetical protein